MGAAYSVADVINLEQDQLEELCLNTWQARTLYALRKCRTMELGGHIDKCNSCHTIHISYNSCRNRHCPSCQGHKVVQWVQAREQELLNVPYFHLVFTLPSQLNTLAIHHPKELYAVLFAAVWNTLNQFGHNPNLLGAQMGMIGVLHTWGQNLSLHPHLHCIVPAGGLSKAGYWKNTKSKGKFLFNVKSMSKVYRAKFVLLLRKKLPGLSQDLYEELFKKQWVVYAKKPFKSNKTVIEYLGRYTHKIAISNYRLQHIDYQNRTVRFSMKDYRKKGAKTTHTLSTKEFIRRFVLHILPKGFTRIRHYGLVSSAWKKEKLPALQLMLGDKKQPIVALEQSVNSRLNKCPTCKVGSLVTLLVFDKRGPPANYKNIICRRIKGV